MSKEKFDKRLRNLFSQYEAKLDKSDWERMNGYLQAQKSRKKRNIFFSLLMLMLTVPCFLSAFYNNDNTLLADLKAGTELKEPGVDTQSPAEEPEGNPDHRKGNAIHDQSSGRTGDKAENKVFDPSSAKGNDESGNQEINTDGPFGKTTLPERYSKRAARARKNTNTDESIDAEGKKDIENPDGNKGPGLGTGSGKDEKLLEDEGLNVQGKQMAEPEKDSVKDETLALKDSMPPQKVEEPQKNKKMSSDPGRFNIAFRFTPALAGVNKTTRAGKEKQVHEDYGNVSAQERSRFGFESAIDFNFRIFKGLSLRSGFNYKLSGQHNEYDYKIERVPVIDAKTKNILAYIKVSDTVGVKRSDNTSYSWLSVPLAASWFFPLGSKISLRLETAVEGSYLAAASGTQARYDDLQQQKFSASDFSRFTWGWNVNAAVIFPLNRGFSAAISPSYSKLSDFSRKESILKSSSSQVGLGFSLMFNLGSLKR